MTLAVDGLARRLEAALGADAVKQETSLIAAYDIDGKQPGLVCFPESSAQVAAAVGICFEAEAAVTPWGGGTAMQIGNPPQRVDVVLDLTRLDHVLEHDDDNLTVTVEAGARLGRLQQAVAARKQFLAFEPPCAELATVGGVVATNLNGPRRSFYGSVRDLVIGMKAVLASGEEIKAGGKVVKNVAGYDMCKLFVGSLGTLGILTEATLRMTPIPETAATVVTAGTLPLVRKLDAELSHSKLLPSAVFLLSPGVSKRDDWTPSDWCLAVCCEGFEISVTRHLQDIEDVAKRVGLSTAILRSSDHQQFWQELRDFPVQAGPPVYRVTVPRALATMVMETVHGWSSSGFRPAIVSDTAMGIIWLASDDQQDPKWFVKLIAKAQEYRGHAVMQAASADLKAKVDVWGPPPLTHSLMREIKRQFDPKNLLNPGRFVGGI